MDDEWIEAWPLFRGKDFRDSGGIGRVSSESVNGLRRQRDDFARTQELDRARDGGLRLYDFGLQSFARASRTSLAASAGEFATAVRCPILRRGRASCLP